MDEQSKKRTNIEDLPRTEEELTEEEAKNVQGGLTKTGLGTLANVRAPGNTIGGALGSTTGNTVGGALGVDPSTKMGDGSV